MPVATCLVQGLAGSVAALQAEAERAARAEAAAEAAAAAQAAMTAQLEKALDLLAQQGR
jgi:hypothetical protein